MLSYLPKTNTLLTASAFFMNVIATQNTLAESTLSTTITATSDYVADGVSQSDSKPALQLGFDYSHNGGIYAGIWASQIDNDETGTPNLELDYTAGYTNPVTDALSYDIGITQYTYRTVNQQDDWNYFEYYLGLTVLENTSLYYFHAEDDKVWNGKQRRLILSHTQAITDSISLLVLAEQLDFEDSISKDYNAFQIGLTTSWKETDLTLSYWDSTLENDDNDLAGNRFVLDISHSLNLN